MSVAGNSSSYTVGIIGADGTPTGKTWDFPRVTTILDDVLAKPRLLGWYYKVTVDGVEELLKRYGPAHIPQDAEGLKKALRANRLTPWNARDDAGSGGTDLHARFEQLATTGKTNKTKGTEGMLRWWSERGLTVDDVVATEVSLVSFNYRYAGTVDIIYRDPNTGALVLSDLKTGKHVHWTHFLQGHAYKQAWEEDGGEPISRVSVLQTRPVGLVKNDCLPNGYKEVTDSSVTFDTFRKVLEIYQDLPLNWKPEEMDA